MSAWFITVVSGILGLVAAVTGYGVRTGIKKRVYWTASIVLFLIAIVSGYDQSRGWDLRATESAVLKKFACSTLPKFPFYVFDLGSVPETNTYGVHLRDVFRGCGWLEVGLFTSDGYLRQDLIGISVVRSSKNYEDENLKVMSKIISDALCKAEIDHKIGSHTRLDETPVKVGIVVGQKPNLWQHIFGYGVPCNGPR